MRRRGRPLAVIAVLAVLACAPDDSVAHTKGLTLSRFGLIDVSLTGQLPEFPLKFGMFLTFEQDKASIEEASLFFHKLGKLSSALSDFQVTAGLSTSSAASGATGKRRSLICRPWGLA